MIGNRRFRGAWRIGKLGACFEGGAMIDGGRFRWTGNIGKLWIGLRGVIWPCEMFDAWR